MDYREHKGDRLSLLGFGCMRLPMVDEKTAEVDEAAARAMVDYAVEHGVNYFDTAYPYHNGNSEPFIGRALEGYARDSFYLATKMPTWVVETADDVHRIFDEQLRRCRVDYFDYYLMHNYFFVYRKKCEEIGVFDILKDKQRQGLIRHLGFSIHDTQEMYEEALALHPWEFIQLQLNYMDWSLTEMNRQYEAAVAKGLPVIVMEPVRGGSLASLPDEAAALLKEADPDASAASWALRYAASLPAAITVLSGMSNLSQVKENVAVLDGFTPVGEDEKVLLYRAAEVVLRRRPIPCTGCRYCMDCPSGVDIPRVLDIYNDYLPEKDRSVFDYGYFQTDRKLLAHNCTACGACMEHCPQRIEIAPLMAEIAGVAEELKAAAQ